ncbi:unnamed protein product [Prunus armeniaca]|uniref:MLO-like protein n=1 Tax=Prunus armeniaca TaxID=36596 RepID=A0A6J5XU61_PRUAR|nr:unnamed protein product [Prunus armeniaca]
MFFQAVLQLNRKSSLSYLETWLHIVKPNSDAESFCRLTCQAGTTTSISNGTYGYPWRKISGLCPLMWFLAAAFMLLDVYGWYVYLWISYVPILVVLVLGTKLEHIIATMALQIKEQNSAVSETPLVQHDDLFWFRKPKHVLVLLHYTLFVNAFEFAFFIWVTGDSPSPLQLHHSPSLCTCGTADILRKWSAEVRHTRKMEQQLSQSEVTSFSTEWSSMRKSLTSTEVPSNTRQASKPAQSIQLLSSRWEIKHEIVEQEGNSSRG